jgi:hypothetical protein
MTDPDRVTRLLAEVDAAARVAATDEHGRFDELRYWRELRKLAGEAAVREQDS